MEAGARGTLIHLILTVLALIANYTMAAIVLYLILRERGGEGEGGGEGGGGRGGGRGEGRGGGYIASLTPASTMTLT